MPKWLLVHSSSGYDVVNERDLTFGPASLGADVEYRDVFGSTVAGVIRGMENSKRKVIEEMERMRGVTDTNGGMEESGEESDEDSIAARRRRRRTESASSAASSQQRAPTPRPTKVGQNPLSSSRKRGGTGVAAVTAPKKKAAIAATPTTRRGPVPCVPLGRVTQNTASPLSSILPTPGQGSFPLLPPSQLPPGFSLTGTPPLSLPTTNDDNSFKQFMMSSMMQMHTELTGIKMMMNSLFLGWNHLIVQSANRSTSAHQEVSGTRERLVEVGNAVKSVETAVQEVSARINKPIDFKYEPYTTKEEIDLIDLNQIITSLAIDIQKVVYDEKNPVDSADLMLAYNSRVDKAKAKWLLEAVLHRRLVSSSDNRLLIQRSIIERLNHAAGRKRRTKEKEERDRMLAGRLATRGQGGRRNGMRGRMETMRGRENEGGIGQGNSEERGEEGGYERESEDEEREEEREEEEREEEEREEARPAKNRLRFDSDEDEDSSEISNVDVV